jgi:hypothetical protein
MNALALYSHTKLRKEKMGDLFDKDHEDLVSREI